jgi:hypothetical protein
MSVNTSNSFSEEMNKSYDSSNFNDSLIEKEERSSYLTEEKNRNEKRISKISLQMEEMKNKINQMNENELDISTDDIDIDLDANEEQKFYKTSIKSLENLRNENVFSKFDIIFSFIFDKQEFLISIESDVFNVNKNSVQDLIKNIINKINEKKIIFQHKKNKYILSLKDCEEESNQEFYRVNYKLRNNESKDFSFGSLLSDIRDKKLNFFCVNTLNLMIRKV